MITIINYGLGNILAFSNIFKQFNIDTVLASTPEELMSAERIILPGVGAFDWAITLLNRSGMREVLDDLVINERKSVLGICVGMQIMARRSDEGVLPGLGWIDGEVLKFSEERGVRGEELGVRRERERVRSKDEGGSRLQLPHMGWNDVMACKKNGLFKNLEREARFYFLHSYYFSTSNPDHVLATTDYNGPYASAVHSGNIYGVQFHPEKSHQWGVQLLKNFAEI